MNYCGWQAPCQHNNVRGYAIENLQSYETISLPCKAACLVLWCTCLVWYDTVTLCVCFYSVLLQSLMGLEHRENWWHWKWPMTQKGPCQLSPTTTRRMQKDNSTSRFHHFSPPTKPLPSRYTCCHVSAVAQSYRAMSTHVWIQFYGAETWACSLTPLGMSTWLYIQGDAWVWLVVAH